MDRRRARPTGRSSTGRDIPCEVRLVRLAGGSRPLVRASITDISERKRAEIIMENERAFFALLASNAGLPAVLDVMHGFEGLG